MPLTLLLSWWNLIFVVPFLLALLYLGQFFPFPADALHGWRLAATLAVPSTLAVVIVGCVPRCAQRVGGNPASNLR